MRMPRRLRISLASKCQLLFGAAVHTLRVRDVMIAGRWVLRDGRFVDLDEEEIYAKGREAAEALWRRIG